MMSNKCSALKWSTDKTIPINNLDKVRSRHLKNETRLLLKFSKTTNPPNDKIAKTNLDTSLSSYLYLKTQCSFRIKQPMVNITFFLTCLQADLYDNGKKNRLPLNGKIGFILHTKILLVILIKCKYLKILNVLVSRDILLI